MIVLAHNASLSARINNRLPSGLPPVLFLGGLAAFILCFSAIFVHFVTNTPIHFMWWIVLMTGASSAFFEDFSQRQRSHYVIEQRKKYDLYEVTEAYWSLNKDHRKMARPLMDRIVTEHANSTAFRDRAERIYALQAREEAERPKATKDDSDLYEIDSYLDLPALKQ